MIYNLRWIFRIGHIKIWRDEYERHVPLEKFICMWSYVVYILHTCVHVYKHDTFKRTSLGPIVKCWNFQIHAMCNLDRHVMCPLSRKAKQTILNLRKSEEREWDRDRETDREKDRQRETDREKDRDRTMFPCCCRS